MWALSLIAVIIRPSLTFILQKAYIHGNDNEVNDTGQGEASAIRL